ncbi:MAG: hypothetical protein ACHREM_12980 [Polyangiales bacterium]
MSDGDEARRDLLNSCDEEIRALIREAHDANVPLHRVVVLVADERDPLGKRVVDACSEYGEPISGSTVYVVGANDAFTRNVLQVAAPMLVDHLDQPAPSGGARLFCFAYGGALVVDLGVALPN